MPSGVYVGNKGKHFSEEHKRKISESLKGNTNTLGYKHTEEARKKMSKVHKGKFQPKRSELLKGNSFAKGKHWKLSEEDKEKKSKRQMGKRNNGWKGGNTPLNNMIRHRLNYLLWRKAIFERDNFTCQKCGQSGGRLNAHHINNFADFPELRFAIDNGITLCDKCHNKFHKQFGRKNNTKEQLKEFLESTLINSGNYFKGGNK